MSSNRLIKLEILRLNTGAWRRKNSARRWELMCELHEQGLNWAQMGAHISRSASTAKRLWQRGWLERQKKAALCAQCTNKFDKLTTYPCYISPRGPGIVWRYNRPRWVMFGGHCACCKTYTQSWPFKLYSYEMVFEKVVPQEGTEGHKVIDFEMVPPAGIAPTTT